MFQKAFLIFLIYSFTVNSNARVATNSSQFDFDFKSWSEFLFDISKTDCSIDINNDLVEPQPLFSNPNNATFWNPTTNGSILVKHGNTIELYCSKSFDKPFQGSQRILASCVGRHEFSVGGRVHYFHEFVCSSLNFHTARRTKRKCFNGATVVEVGYQLSEPYKFLQTMEICHDEINQATLYTHHVLNPSSANYQRSVPRTRFIEGDFYDKKNVDFLYTKEQQKKTFGKILNGNHEKFFNESRSIFLARGHLSAKADHIYGSQQLTTFYFINAAPQWQVFNAGNWERIETGVRNFVAKRGLVVDCYTGTWDVMELPDKNGNMKKLHLSMDENNNYQIPVPKFYYRVVIDRKTKYGIVLIGVNNPHLTMNQIRKDYILCDDVGEKIKWINWKKDNILAGYSYACDVNQFRKVVNHLPPLEVRGLLI